MENYLNVLTNVDICSSEAGEQIIGFLANILLFIKISIPVILILVGTITLVKAVATNEEEKRKKAVSSLIKKVIIAVVIFFIPTIVNLVMNLVGQGENACVSNLLSPSAYQQKSLEKKMDTAQTMLYEGKVLKINEKEYTVKVGDTIESIAKENKISEKELIKENNLTNEFNTCSLNQLTQEENCDIMSCETNNKCTQIDGTWYCCTESLKGSGE